MAQCRLKANPYVQSSTAQGVLRLPGVWITDSWMCNGLPIGERGTVTADMDKAGPHHTTHVCQASALSDLADGGEELAISLR